MMAVGLGILSVLLFCISGWLYVRDKPRKSRFARSFQHLNIQDSGFHSSPEIIEMVHREEDRRA